MKRILFYLVFSFIFCFSSCDFATAQGINKLGAACQSPNVGTSQSLILQADGNINAIPCPSGNFQINGVNVSAGGTTGSGTAGTIPVWATSTSLGDSFITSNSTATSFYQSSNAWFGFVRQTGGTQGVFYSNLAGTITWKLGTSGLLVNLGNQVASFNTGSGNFQAGDLLTAVNGTQFVLVDSTGRFTFSSNATTPTFDITSVRSFLQNRTITPAGTTGNQTINTRQGTVNFAAVASDIVVTNSLATTTSLISCTVQSLDATAISCRITDKAAGSFHVRIPAATAETSVMFQVDN